MTGRHIEIPSLDGGTFKAYLAVPKVGEGPGIVLCQEIFGVNEYIRQVADYYADEGYVVIAPDLFWRMDSGVELGHDQQGMERALSYLQRFDIDKGVQDIAASIAELRGRIECTGKVGVLGFCLGGLLAYIAAARTDADCTVAYYGVGIEKHLLDVPKCPVVLHFAENDQHCDAAARETIHAALSPHTDVEIYVYREVNHGFARTGSPLYHKPSASMAHQRSVALYRSAMGPHFNLSALWDKHCEYEFETRDVDATMATMVAEPYVNHIPTMTGGVGYQELHHFYQNHFVHKNPPDTKLIPLSRTVGATQIVDEQLFCFTHTCEIDWMLPGIKPTGKYVEIPLVAIVKFRGDKLYHEHIYWDQASVLVQIGALDPAGLPVAGLETARKLLDESLPSNALMRLTADSTRTTPGGGRA